MGKALVVKNVDFSVNALTQVQIEDEVPCTSVLLSASGQSVNAVGDTITVTAALTPANTTDVLVWETSDSRIATVSNGIVTVVGMGNATITATCGNASASVTIAQGSIKFTAISVHNGCYPGSYGNDNNAGCVQNNSAQSILGGEYNAKDTTLHIINNTAYDGVNQIIPIPFGATKIAVHTSDGTRIWAAIVKYDLVNRTLHGGEQYPTYISKTSIYITDEEVCEYGQAVAYRSGTDAMNSADYVVFS